MATTGFKLPPLQRTSQLKALVGTLLWYGPAGGGKTFGIKKLKEHLLNPLVLATELGKTRGLLTLQSEDIPFIEIDSHAMLMEVLAELKKKPGKVEYQQVEFGAVVLDSITQWGQFPLDRFMVLKNWPDLSTPQDKKDPRQAYGYLAEMGLQLYKSMFDLHAHIGVIAREGLFGDGSPENPYFNAPELPGAKLPRELPGWPDATVRLRRVAGQRIMMTQTEGFTPARVRLPADYPPLPERCSPDVGALIRFLCGEREMIDLLRLPPSAAEIAKEREAAEKAAKARPAATVPGIAPAAAAQQVRK